MPPSKIGERNFRHRYYEAMCFAMKARDVVLVPHRVAEARTRAGGGIGGKVNSAQWTNKYA